MTAVHDWLGTRSPEPPQRLVARMRLALDGADERDDLIVALGDAALRCLRAALHADTRDAAALDLLAADGLLTYAWEAAAADGVAGLERFASTYSPDRIAAVLTERA